MRTLTQEDPGDNQITLEEVVQMLLESLSRSAPPTWTAAVVFPKVSNLIASEILRNEEINARVSAIEKWVAVADICRCLHNYNAVLEITSSLNRSAIFRLKKTWLKVSKQVGWRGRTLRGGGQPASGLEGRVQRLRA
nr:PREDICTED: ras-specific guanine nucleotide-releasing factor 1-like [Struthio camelus australis]